MILIEFLELLIFNISLPKSFIDNFIYFKKCRKLIVKHYLQNEYVGKFVKYAEKNAVEISNEYSSSQKNKTNHFDYLNELMFNVYNKIHYEILQVDKVSHEEFLTEIPKNDCIFYKSIFMGMTNTEYLKKTYKDRLWCYRNNKIWIPKKVRECS